MKSNELAKKLLSGEIPSEFAWIYEITNGRIPKEKYNILASIIKTEAYKRGFDIRIIKFATLITMDWQLKRINIELDNEDNIIKIYLG